MSTDTAARIVRGAQLECVMKNKSAAIKSGNIEQTNERSNIKSKYDLESLQFGKELKRRSDKAEKEFLATLAESDKAKLVSATNKIDAPLGGKGHAHRRIVASGSLLDDLDQDEADERAGYSIEAKIRYASMARSSSLKNRCHFSCRIWL